MDDKLEACQTLANLCVLQLYDQSTTACNIFQQLMSQKTNLATFSQNYGVSSWKEGLPWLYYSEKALDIVKKSGRLDLTVSYYQPSESTPDRTSRLTFYLGRYALNGTFIGFEVLRD
jgi:meckelin